MGKSRLPDLKAMEKENARPKRIVAAGAGWTGGRQTQAGRPAPVCADLRETSQFGKYLTDQQSSSSAPPCSTRSRVLASGHLAGHGAICHARVRADLTPKQALTGLDGRDMGFNLVARRSSGEWVAS